MTKRDVKIARFKEWLAERGAEVLIPTNAWEIVRFRTDGTTSIIYVKKGGSCTFTGTSREAWDAFEAGNSSMRFSKRENNGFDRRKRDVVIRSVLERDGSQCFYCGAEFNDDLRPTKEHLVSRTCGGPDHISNIFLACQPCNNEAGTMSAPEKISLRDRKRAPIEVSEV